MKSQSCVLIGYDSHYKGYNCLEPVTRKFFITPYVVFDETQFPITKNPTSSHNIQFQFALDIVHIPTTSNVPKTILNVFSTHTNQNLHVPVYPVTTHMPSVNTWSSISGSQSFSSTQAM